MTDEKKDDKKDAEEGNGGDARPNYEGMSLREIAEASPNIRICTDKKGTSITIRPK